MKEKLVIIGAGGHGKVVADIALKLNCYKEIVFLDDSAKGSTIGIHIVGVVNDYTKWIESSDFIVAIGNSKIREFFLNLLKNANASFATLVHPNAVVGTDVVIGEGTVVMAGAIINSGARVGKGVIVNTACSIDHDNTIGDFCHISVGSHLGGTVKVGDHTMIGAGATVINNIEICEECIIGAGAVVVKNIYRKGTFIGVPMRNIR